MRRFIPWFAGVVVICSLAVWVGQRHPGVPYNVREALGHTDWLRGGFFWAIVLYTALGSPMAVARLLVSVDGVPVGSFLSFTTIQSVFLAVLLVSGAPVESIHDLVGSPTLGWPHCVELACRLVGLVAAPFAILNSAALLALGGSNRVLHWDILGAIALALTAWYGVVVLGANTDNITELLPNQGHSMRLGALALWFFLMGIGSSFPAALAGSGRWARFFFFLVIVAAAVPAAWWLLQWGTESRVFKYGRTFSAFQFLLSSGRERLVEGRMLFLRYALVHLGAAILGMICQFSVLAPGCERPSHRADATNQGRVRKMPD
ncbi:hypothetical protein SAMN02746041_02585 [Desulfacinum hydrothermale DSM 13146]|uniref:Uncharacterized protein n=1 Tax=Desulfacinum hydrothermale DSM 13146 TaxID=1121390 RepID=A0A1W1XRW9_9BACT|nr:hypothetical protein [Desulfacinum hydrothermale]SMC26258.1 hypothetical protein SAMN02746041_02585 [Desulfacinum hydrothermale DSM 13146]